MELLVMASRLVSIREYAKFSSFAQITIRRRIKDGTLPAVQLGGPGKSWRILVDDQHAGLPVIPDTPGTAPLSTTVVGTDGHAVRATSRARIPRWRSHSGI